MKSNKKIKLSGAQRYGLALIADGKSNEVRAQTLRALERRGLAAWRYKRGEEWHILTAAGEDWLGIAEEFRTAQHVAESADVWSYETVIFK